MQRVIIVSLLLLSVGALAAPSQQLELQVPPDPQSQRATDLVYSPIKPVTDENRYTTLNPDVKLTALKKVKHAKGNMVFSSGERISGKFKLMRKKNCAKLAKWITFVSLSLSLFLPYSLVTRSSLFTRHSSLSTRYSTFLTPFVILLLNHSPFSIMTHSSLQLPRPWYITRRN